MEVEVLFSNTKEPLIYTPEKAIIISDLKYWMFCDEKRSYGDIMSSQTQNVGIK